MPEKKEEEEEEVKKLKKKKDKREERRGKAVAGRLKQGAAGDAPGGGRRRVRRFAPRLPVTCLVSPQPPRPHPFSSFAQLSFRFSFFPLLRSGVYNSTL